VPAEEDFVDCASARHARVSEPEKAPGTTSGTELTFSQNPGGSSSKSISMAGTMLREINQLLRTARHYIAQAESVLSRYQQLESMTIGQITKAHSRGGLSPGEMVLAHYGSASVRLATICEIQGYKPTQNYRIRFYERSGKRRTAWTRREISGEITNNLQEHIHLLLRDNVAHEEPGIKNNRDIAADRFAILKVVSIDACRKALKKTVRIIDSSL